MALLLDEIAWGESLLPARSDPAWEAEIRRRGAKVSEVDRRVVTNRWLREMSLRVATYHPTVISERLYHIGIMVTAQENACRYCYGANRAYLKIQGYSEDFIRRIERDAQVAELDEKERAFIAFCRSLARSRPRPARDACDRLVDMGFTRQAVHEMALVIAVSCCYNRVSTLLICPPEQDFERMANGPRGHVIGLLARLSRPFRRGRPPMQTLQPMDVDSVGTGPYGAVLAPLAALPGVRILKDALDGTFASDVLDPRTKALMFAVVARTLGCKDCESRATDMLAGQGMKTQDIDMALTNLRAEGLPTAEAGLLPWARATVHYETGRIQQETRTLAATLAEPEMIEAIGVASLANAMVRLGMLSV